MRISDGTDVCSSDLLDRQAREHQAAIERASEDRKHYIERMSLLSSLRGELVAYYDVLSKHIYFHRLQEKVYKNASEAGVRSEEHTSELQSLMRISYAVFCWKKKKQTTRQ